MDKLWHDNKTGICFRVISNRDGSETYIQHTKEVKGTQVYYWNDTRYIYEYQSDNIKNFCGSWTINVNIKKKVKK